MTTTLSTTAAPASPAEEARPRRNRGALVPESAVRPALLLAAPLALATLLVSPVLLGACVWAWLWLYPLRRCWWVSWTFAWVALAVLGALRPEPVGLDIPAQQTLAHGRDVAGLWVAGTPPEAGVVVDWLWATWRPTWPLWASGAVVVGEVLAVVVGWRRYRPRHLTLGARGKERRALSAGTILGMREADVRWAVDRFAGTGVVTFISAFAKVGKSYLTCGLIRALEDARRTGAGEWFGIALDPAWKWLYATEETYAVFRDKLKAFGLTDAGLAVVSVTEFAGSPWAETVAWLHKEAVRLGCQGVIVDTLGRWCPDAEGTTEGANLAIGPITVSAQAGMAWLLLMHDSKSGSEKDGAVGVRGHGQLAGNADIIVRAKRKGEVTVLAQSGRHGERLVAARLRISDMVPVTGRYEAIPVPQWAGGDEPDPQESEQDAASRITAEAVALATPEPEPKPGTEQGTSQDRETIRVLRACHEGNGGQGVEQRRLTVILGLDKGAASRRLSRLAKAGTAWAEDAHDPETGLPIRVWWLSEVKPKPAEEEVQSASTLEMGVTFPRGNQMGTLDGGGQKEVSGGSSGTGGYPPPPTPRGAP